jgi:hypothetical protein
MEDKERWMELCEQASKEPDPERLLELVRQVNALLEEKETRLRSGAGDAESDQVRPCAQN